MRKCLAIAFRWVFAPPTIDSADSSVAYDLALVVSRCWGTIESDQIRVANGELPKTSVFHSKLPQKEQAVRLSDVSGTLGVIYPTSGKHLARRASASERLISDAVIWALSEQTLEGVDPVNNPTLILVQGPLLPKLRGRLLYRGIGEGVKFFALTYHDEWLQSIEAAPRMISSLQNRDISEMYPPAGIDKSTRSWVARRDHGKDSRHFYHLETVADPETCCDRPHWKSEIEGDVRLIAGNCTYLINKPFASTTPLPAPLASATREAKVRRNGEAHFARLLPQLRAGIPIKEIVNSPECGVLAKHLQNSTERSEDELLQAGTTGPLDWKNEAEVYSRFTKIIGFAKLPQIL